MPTPTDDTILTDLRALSPASRAAAVQLDYSTSLTCLGLTTPVMRTYAKRLRDAYQAAAPDTVLDLAHALVRTGVWDARAVAYLLIEAHRPAQRALNRRWLIALCDGNDCWNAVDTFAMCCSGPAWRQGQVPDNLFLQWAKSKNEWERRTALASTVYLNRKSAGSTGDVPRTLAICERLADTRTPQLIKALSWALRTIGEWDPVAVQEFVAAHDAVLAAQVKREVHTKLATGMKSGRSRKSA